MLDSYNRFWQNYANFKGRSTRADYWWVMLVNFLIGLVLGFIPEIIPAMSGVTVAITGLYSLAALIPGLALFTRSLHDTGKSGWNWLWCLLPFAGSIVLLVFLCQRSVTENNKYRV